MRTLFVLTFAANLILAAVSMAVLPDRVAIHFGIGGRPDGWAPAWINALVFAGMDVLLFVSLFFAHRCAFAFPDRWINLPNKDYWLAPERREEAKARMARAMGAFGTVLFLFLGVACLLVIRANLSDPVRLDERAFLAALGLFIGFTAIWLVRFFRAYRIPGPGDGASARGMGPG